jgi:hypothetical protein
MRLPDAAHTARPWRIHEISAGFRLEDVWALPTPGRREDFPRLVEWLASRDDPSGPAGSPAVRALWAVRWAIGKVLRWDGRDAWPGAAPPSIRHRLPPDLGAAGPGPRVRGLPLTSLYLLDDEWAAEIANRTVHGILHLGWVADEHGGYHGQMAILVKPNGLLGNAYLAGIKPVRLLLVYPKWIQSIEQGWRRHETTGPAPAARLPG